MQKFHNQSRFSDVIREKNTLTIYGSKTYQQGNNKLNRKVTLLPSSKYKGIFCFFSFFFFNKVITFSLIPCTIVFFRDKTVRHRFIGDLTLLPEDLQQLACELEDSSRHNNGWVGWTILDTRETRWIFEGCVFCTTGSCLVKNNEVVLTHSEAVLTLYNM